MLSNRQNFCTWVHSDINISQGGLMKRLSHCVIFNDHFIANLLLSMLVKEFRKSFCIGQSYDKNLAATFVTILYVCHYVYRVHNWPGCLRMPSWSSSTFPTVPTCWPWQHQRTCLYGLLYTSFCTHKQWQRCSNSTGMLPRSLCSEWVRVVTISRHTRPREILLLTTASEEGTCYNAAYTIRDRDQQHFTISELAADWHEIMERQNIM